MTIRNMADTQLATQMMRLSTGARINSAADDAAGLGISQRMTAQIRGLEQGIRNVSDMQSVTHVAEGGLSSIDNSLHRIRELSVQAENGILTDGDRRVIQNEINQLLDHIDRAAGDTEFNTQNVLDGSFADRHTAADANAQGPTINIADSSVVGLNLQGYDVTDPGALGQNLGRIDRAMAQVSGARAYLGAMSNRMEHINAAHGVTLLNQAASRSRIADQDMALGVMELNRENLLREFGVQMEVTNRRQQQEQQQFGLMTLMAGV